MRIQLVVKFCAVLLSCLTIAPSRAASFDCAKASTAVEKLVCSSPALSRADEELNQVYRNFMADANTESRDHLVLEQRRWLAQTRNACQDEACLSRAYASRKEALAAFFDEKSPLYNREREKRPLLNNNDPYVVVSCDTEGQTLNITEGRADREEDIPRFKNAWSLGAMLKFTPDGTGDGLLEEIAPLQKECTAGRAKYTLVIHAYKFNHRIQGRCGAAAPSVKLTLLRDGKILIKDLIFRLNCFEDGDDENEIESVWISEPGQHATFYIRNDEVTRKRVVDFNMLPSLSRDMLLQ